VNTGFGTLIYYYTKACYGCDGNAVQTTLSTAGWLYKNKATYLALSDILLYLKSNVSIISLIAKHNPAERTAPVQSFIPTLFILPI